MYDLGQSDVTWILRRVSGSEGSMADPHSGICKLSLVSAIATSLSLVNTYVFDILLSRYL